MTKILVCEGRYDAIVLRTILAAADLSDVQVMEGGGKSSAISLGTSFALNGDARVAIVVDADTTDQRRLQEQQLIFDDLAGRISDRGSCKLFLAVPTLEDTILPTASDFSSTFGVRITPRQQARYAEDWNLVVKAFLTTPAADSMTMIKTKGIPPARLRALFKIPLMRTLKEYLEQE